MQPRSQWAAGGCYYLSVHWPQLCSKPELKYNSEDNVEVKLGNNILKCLLCSLNSGSVYCSGLRRHQRLARVHTDQTGLRTKAQWYFTVISKHAFIAVKRSVHCGGIKSILLVNSSN